MSADKMKLVVQKILEKKNAAIVFAAAVLVVIVGATAVLAVSVFGDNENNTPDSSVAGSETSAYEDIVELVEGYIDEYQRQKMLKVSAGNCSVEICASDADAPVDYDGLRDYIEAKGGDPDAVALYRTVQSAMNVAAEEIDTDYISSKLSELEVMLDPGGDGRYEIKGDSVIVYRGVPHLSFDAEASCGIVKAALENCDYSDVILETEEKKGVAPNWDQLYSDFCIAPTNAEYSVDDAGNTVIVPSKMGRDIDLEEIKECYRREDWTKKTFSGVVVRPEITTSNIDDGLFLDVLGEKTTTFLEAETSRSNNIKLATASIDGCIILPGFKFSFNNTVGERTEERGYQDALIYVNDGVEPGLGGGICQVSSTLYNATLEAGLKQYSRTCHQFTVFYVDLGFDATVSWGNLDYIFVNNTKYPIKIEASAENGVLNIKILGTKNYETRKVYYRYQVVETYGYETLTTVDETLAPGTKNYKSHGRNGYRVETYMTVIQDGERYAEEWIATSIYDPIDTVVTEGPPLETTARVERTTKATTAPPTQPPPAVTTASGPASQTGTTAPGTSAEGQNGGTAENREPPVSS